MHLSGHPSSLPDLWSADMGKTATGQGPQVEDVLTRQCLTSSSHLSLGPGLVLACFSSNVLPWVEDLFSILHLPADFDLLPVRTEIQWLDLEGGISAILPLSPSWKSTEGLVAGLHVLALIGVGLALNRICRSQV